MDSYIYIECVGKHLIYIRNIIMHTHASLIQSIGIVSKLIAILQFYLPNPANNMNRQESNYVE